MPTWARTSPVALSITRMRPGQFRAERVRRARGQRFEARLQPRVDGRADDRRSLGRATAASAAWAAIIGKGAPLGRRLGPGAGAASLGGQAMRCRQRAIEHAVARARAAFGHAIGRGASGDCGNATSSAASAERQALRLLAEIGEARGAQALDIAAIGRQRKIEIEDLRLVAAAASSCTRAHICRSLAASVRSARGSSRRATCMVRVEPPETTRPWRHMPGGARRRAGVDAAMLREAPILIGDQHREKRGSTSLRRAAAASARPAS